MQTEYACFQTVPNRHVSHQKLQLYYISNRVHLYAIIHRVSKPFLLDYVDYITEKAYTLDEKTAEFKQYYAS